jgi:hypothetical protein
MHRVSTLSLYNCLFFSSYSLKEAEDFRKLKVHEEQLKMRNGLFLASYLVMWILSGVRLSPLGTAATTGLLYRPQMIDDGGCGAVGGMRIGKGNRSTRRKHAPAPLRPPQIPHDQTPSRRGGTPATNRLRYGAALPCE